MHHDQNVVPQTDNNTSSRRAVAGRLLRRDDELYCVLFLILLDRTNADPNHAFGTHTVSCVASRIDARFFFFFPMTRARTDRGAVEEQNKTSLCKTTITRRLLLCVSRRSPRGGGCELMQGWTTDSSFSPTRVSKAREAARIERPDQYNAFRFDS